MVIAKQVIVYVDYIAFYSSNPCRCEVPSRTLGLVVDCYTHSRFETRGIGHGDLQFTIICIKSKWRPETLTFLQYSVCTRSLQRHVIMQSYRSSDIIISG